MTAQNRYETVIGLEVHAQLLTQTKMFCGCANRFGDEANANVCPICLGMPGTLPVMNEQALEMALRVMIATGCKINTSSIMARKNYFYPDLPKGYQISQYELPIAEFGRLPITMDEQEIEIGITRIHLEEDAGKSIHQEGQNSSLMDYNRCGTPLIEIVSEPEMTGPEQAVAYLKTLHRLVVYLGVCDGNMEQGSFRCDANLSIRPIGQKELGTKVEIKNMNSFRHIQKALSYEVKRQTAALFASEPLIQETRLWDEGRGITLPMRSKEEAHDYRYFPDPDLPAVLVADDTLARVVASRIELPWKKQSRFEKQYGISPKDSEQLTAALPLADYFETVAKSADPKTAANWIMGELQGRLNSTGQTIEQNPVLPETLAELIGLIECGTISGKIAKEVFSEMFTTGEKPGAIVKKRGLVQITDESTLEDAVEKVMEAHPEQVIQYQNGNARVLGFLMGQVMKQTQGKANPNTANLILKKKLDQA